MLEKFDILVRKVLDLLYKFYLFAVFLICAGVIGLMVLLLKA